MTDQPKKRGGKRKGSGRKNGSVSKSTLRKIAITAAESQAKEHVAAAIEEARAQGLMEGKDHRGRKRAVTVLEEFMMLFSGMALVYQPAAPNQPKREHEDEVKFREYARMAVDTAGQLANYQSPRFKAITVLAPPPERTPEQISDSAKVINITDVNEVGAAYRRLISKVAG